MIFFFLSDDFKKRFRAGTVGSPSGGSLTKSGKQRGRRELGSVTQEDVFIRWLNVDF